jgi:D-psicose/D-tagatose/L-ribulose 3-epimerase
MAMRLAISHIAWPAAEEETFLRHIREWGCSGVEIAPSRVWPEPLDATPAERRAFKSLVDRYDLEIPGFQALLYNRPDLGVFRDRHTEAEAVKYLIGLCHLAADLGARVLVFGSPGNRRRGELSLEEAFARAAAFFCQVAPKAHNLGVCLCIEPLRPEETDFIITAQEGMRLVEMVDHPGFGLHLDAKAVSAEPGDPLQIIRRVRERTEHFHINDPGLVEVNRTGMVDHAALARALHETGYNGYVSIEMRLQPDHHQVIPRTIIFCQQTYLQVSSGLESKNAL